MDTAKTYQDSHGNERTIHQMVKDEPYWAAVRIQEGEKAIDRAEQLSECLKVARQAIAEIRHAHGSGERWYTHGESRLRQQVWLWLDKAAKAFEAITQAEESSDGS